MPTAITHRAGAFLLIAAGLACGGAGSGGVPLPEATATEEEADTVTIRIRETTQQQIADHIVGVGNIYTDDEEDVAEGAPLRLGATVFVRDPASGERRKARVYEGSEVAVGDARYVVDDIAEGDSSPGWLVLRSVAP